MSKIMLLGPFIFFLAYVVLPRFITRIFKIAVYQKEDLHKEIALTFDDGPNPIYTPILLDVLNKNGVKATFFVLGANAEKFPDLISRIHEEGHLIGIHNYDHFANCFMTPKQVRRQVQHSADIVHKITGERPTFYRPPWGMPNLFEIFKKKKLQMKMIMWSVMVGDWNRKVGSENLKNRLLNSVHGGAIIVLHDSGETWGADKDAPSQMIVALEEVLQELSQRGYKYIRIDQMVNKNGRGGSEFDTIGEDILSHSG